MPPSGKHRHFSLFCLSPPSPVFSPAPTMVKERLIFFAPNYQAC